MNITENLQSKFFNKFSLLLNSYKSVISVVEWTLNDSYCILALDSLGIINVWIIDENIFNFGKGNNQENEDFHNDELIDFSDTKVIYPEMGFDINQIVKTINPDLSESRSICFSKMEKINDEFLIICGDFNTFLIRKEQIEKKICNKISSVFPNKSKLQIPIELLESDINLLDFSISSKNSINGFDIDYDSNRILTFSDSGLIFLYDLNNFDLIFSSDTNDFPQYKFSESPCTILSGKFIYQEGKGKMIVLGTDEGNLIFMDINGNYCGLHNVSLNKFIRDNETLPVNEEYEVQNKESINEIEDCLNYFVY
jgi:WD40 repeat protein